MIIIVEVSKIYVSGVTHPRLWRRLTSHGGDAASPPGRRAHRPLEMYHPLEICTSPAKNAASPAGNMASPLGDVRASSKILDM